MSLQKYRLREVASDFGTTPKEISEIVEEYFEKPKSNTQVLTDEELNVVFDCMTQKHPIDSLEQVYAVQPKEAAKETPKAPAAKPAQNQNHNQQAKQDNHPAQKPAQNNQASSQNHSDSKPAKAAEPQRKRERRVVDTSAVQVNSARFDDRVDSLISERAQNFTGGKQRIGGGKKQQNKRDNKFKGNKARNEEQEKMRRLQMEVARKAPLTDP